MSINLHFDTGSISSEEADGLTALIGAIRPSLPNAKELAKRYDNPYYGSTAMSQGPISPPPVDNAHVAENATPFTEEDVAANAPKRERGQPAPGKSRRTKAEVEEDRLADEADAANGTAAPETETVAGPVDNEDDAAQDAADEAAEVAATTNPDAPLTGDDVKALMVQYQAAYGQAVFEDGPKIFNGALGNPPEGNAGWRVSLIPDDQDKLRAARDAWLSALENNTYNREKV